MAGFTITANKTQRRRERIKTRNIVPVNQFEKLPNEIVAHIFGFLHDGLDLLDCAQVCNQFNNVIKETPNLIELKQKTRQNIFDVWKDDYVEHDDDHNYIYSYDPEDKYDCGERFYNKYGGYSYEP